MLRRHKGSRVPDNRSAEPDGEVDDPTGGAGEARGPADEAGGPADEVSDEPTVGGSVDVLARPPVEQLSDARLLYDCATWSRDDRAALDAALGAASIDRVWQGPELVVGLLDEHLVDEALEELGVGQAQLSVDTDQIVYEVGEWPRVLRDSLAESLLVAGIAAGWDDVADLHVAAADEAAVDDILDAMPDPDEVFEEAEGTEVQDLLTQLYAAVDRLKDNPKIPGARLDVVEAADRMDRLAVPFGFDAAQWRDLVERAGDLRDEIDRTTSTGPDDDLNEGDPIDGATTEQVDAPADRDPAADDPAALADDGEADDSEQTRNKAALASFALRSGQLRDRLVRLV